MKLTKSTVIEWLLEAEYGYPYDSTTLSHSIWWDATNTKRKSLRKLTLDELSTRYLKLKGML